MAHGVHEVKSPVTNSPTNVGFRSDNLTVYLLPVYHLLQTAVFYRIRDCSDYYQTTTCLAILDGKI